MANLAWMFVVIGGVMTYFGTMTILKLDIIIKKLEAGQIGDKEAR